MGSLHLVGHDGADGGRDALALSRAIAPRARRVVAYVTRTPPDRAVDDLRGSLRAGEELRILRAASATRALRALAAELQADVVALGAGHRPRLAAALAGTQADHLLHVAPCTVAVATDGLAAGDVVLRRLLVAYDGSDEAGNALDVAGRLALANDGVVDVVTVIAPLLPTDHAAGPVLATQLRRDAELRAAEMVGEALDRVPQHCLGRGATPWGPVGAAVVGATSALGTDMVVLGSWAYGAMRRALLGSTVHYVLHHAPCPVLVVPRHVAAREPDRRGIRMSDGGGSVRLTDPGAAHPA
jgi:nucleotide-binding universal stress UspA family protein